MKQCVCGVHWTGTTYCNFIVYNFTLHPSDWRLKIDVHYTQHHLSVFHSPFYVCPRRCVRYVPHRFVFRSLLDILGFETPRQCASTSHITHELPSPEITSLPQDMRQVPLEIASPTTGNPPPHSITFVAIRREEQRLL